MRWWANKKKHLASAVSGRELSGLFIEDDNTLRLRFSDNSAALVCLSTRSVSKASAHDYQEWLTLPGWVRIYDVLEDEHQITLIVSGAIYTSRISIRHSKQRWQFVFPNKGVL